MFLIVAFNQLVESNENTASYLISAAAARFLKSACINAPYELYHLFSPHKRCASHPLIFFIYAHSETHGRSCKKIKEKAIRSVGESFSCRSRSMAHEVADTYTHTCAHNTYTRTASWIRDCICFFSPFFCGVFFSSFFIFYFFFIESLSHLSLHCTLLRSAFEIR